MAVFENRRAKGRAGTVLNPLCHAPHSYASPLSDGVLGLYHWRDSPVRSKQRRFSHQYPTANPQLGDVNRVPVLVVRDVCAIQEGTPNHRTFATSE